MKFKIGNIEIKNPVVLAPLAGISNPSYIKICEEMGVGYAVTELISAEAIIRNNKKTFDMLNGINSLNIPVAVQLFGSNPESISLAAKILTEKFNIKIIDINMGCPVPKVALRSQAGSALLKDVKKIEEIVKSVVKAVNVPVTVKIRSGWDNDHINATEVAIACEKAGASAIAIHARTRSQGYSGYADWNIIKKVKESVKIPVIGNGDVTSVQKFKQMLDETNCDAIMIGRGCIGNPWLIKECVDYLNNKKSEPVTIKDKIDMMKKHLDLLIKDKIEKVAILEMRSQLLYYFKSMPDSKKIKMKICTAKTKDELINILDNYLIDNK